MNYYPNNNYYQNYAYQPQQQMQQMVSALQGKVVDSIDMVRVNEIPFGGFGVFPKGDLSEIYIKSWNNNGTTQINTYKPVPAEEIDNTNVKESELLTKINALNEKLDILMKGTATNLESKKDDSAAAAQVKVNAY